MHPRACTWTEESHRPNGKKVINGSPEVVDLQVVDCIPFCVRQIGIAVHFLGRVPECLIQLLDDLFPTVPYVVCFKLKGSEQIQNAHASAVEAAFVCLCKHAFVNYMAWSFPH